MDSETDPNSNNIDEGDEGLKQVQAENDKDDTHSDTSVHQSDSKQDNQLSPADNS